MPFTPIKVSRAASSHSKRTIPNVSIAQTKAGDLSIILSPDFFTAHPALFVGARIIVAFDPKTEQLALIPAESGMSEGVRVIRKRPSLEGAGTVHISAKDVPDALSLPAKRSPMGWSASTGGAISLHMGF